VLPTDLSAQVKMRNSAVISGLTIMLLLILSMPPVSNTTAQTRSVTEVILIPAGPFWMGSDSGPPDERPRHRVQLAAYYIDRTPVTHSQFTEFLNHSGHVNAKGERLFDIDDPDARIHKKSDRWVTDSGFENNPVVEVSWNGARDYCGWASKRLPTEAEWEKAARGTDGRKFPWGEDLPDRSKAQFNAAWNETAPVGKHPQGASPYGVLDLAGNAWEWVSSAYTPYPYDSKDGREAPTLGPERVTRGGGQDSGPEHLTTSYRGARLSRNFRSGHHNIGFRCARS